MLEGGGQTQEARLSARKTSASDRQTLRECLCEHLQGYLDQLGDGVPGGLYELVISEVEIPLFENVLRHTNGNLSLAAELLGIHRSTLRRRMVRHGLI